MSFMKRKKLILFMCTLLMSSSMILNSYAAEISDFENLKEGKSSFSVENSNLTNIKNDKKPQQTEPFVPYASSYDISINEWYYMDINENSSNNIYAEFTIPQDGFIEIQFERTVDAYGDEGEWYVDLYDTNSNHILYGATSYEPSPTDNYIRYKVGLKAGKYKLSLNPSFTVSSGSFNVPLKVNYTASNNFEKENNDSKLSANKINLNATYNAISGEGFLTDEDYFKFNVSKKSNIKFKIKHDPNKDFSNYYLYDQYGNNVGSASEDWDMNIEGSYYTYTFSNLNPGDYILQIYGYDVKVPYEFSVNTVTNGFTGWKLENGKWYYYYDNVKKTGWVLDNNVWYYCDSYGAMKTGWIKDAGKWYYMSTNGSMKIGWVKDSGKWYYTDNSGVMKTGWLKDAGKWYYMDSSGVMKTGWLKDAGKWYYMDSSGVMKTGWLKDASKWYYMDSSGVMKTGWLKDAGKWYYTDSSGVMKTGWLKDAGLWYYTDSSGVMKTGWLKDAGLWYYMDSSGVMKTGWLNINNNTYYLNSSGVMVTGKITINNVIYNFDGSGVLIK